MRYTKKERELLIREYQESGSPVKEWSNTKGIAYSTFRGWLKAAEQEQIIRVDEKQQEPAIVWAELKAPDKLPEAAENAHKNLISLSREGWTIKIETSFDAELLAEVMKVVNRVCC